MIETQELTKTYSDGSIGVDRLSLRVEKGEIFCLLGANGAGKTTTLNMLLGFVKPTSGSATIDGIEVETNPVRARRLLAYIPEQVSLYPYLSGLENLTYFAQLSGQERSRAELRRLLVDSGLAEDSLDRKVSAYSKGMRQKVAIALAVAKRARVLLLDEPTSGLDPQASFDFSELLKRLSREQEVTVLMATHDLFRVKELAARAVIMKRGVAVQELSTEDIGHADLERLYLEYMGRTP